MDGNLDRSMNSSDEADRPRFLLPENELSEKFILTGGPGGQHVNRTATGVQLRFDVAASACLTDAVKERLLKLAGSRADSAGVITIAATSHRSQLRNREEARKRLVALIEEAQRAPRKRIATRPPPAAKKKRLAAKRHRADLKQRRGEPGLDE
jgi:ribosome-associated protein